MLLITIEVLLIIVIPLIVLYLRGKWPLNKIVICLLVIPILSIPYLSDLASIFTGAVILQHGLSKNAFWVGFLFMLLCLRPAFDLACETISFYSGFRGDLFHIQQIVGNVTLSSFLLLSLGLSVFLIYAILKP